MSRPNYEELQRIIARQAEQARRRARTVAFEAWRMNVDPITRMPTPPPSDVEDDDVNTEELPPPPTWR